jgi:hypothetical protein
MIKLLTIVVLTISFSGCGSNSKPTPPLAVKKTVAKIDKKDSQGRPLWLSNPNIDGYQGVVSVVSKQKVKNKKKLLYIAKMKAQAAFQTRKGTIVDSTTKIRTTTSGETSLNEKVKISSCHIQTNKLIVKDTFEDKKNFYMWMVVGK